ncbi:hypothetical protein SteCoe_8744 [Stentor coeruleus]|uniref:EF-hand domain-containing protein n=1 Tax=Stentor coeruleus TaxID=5963 RepID=A0A1R2CJB4_9CILI|nr:hypothetical protein SteCoe_8744 [Stentor coeruleus]
MSNSEWSSDIEVDIEELKEDATILMVKSSNQAQFLSTLNKPLNSDLKTLEIPPITSTENTEQVSRLATSYSPEASLGSLSKTPIKFKINAKIMDIFDDIKSPPPKTSDINERFFKFKEKVKAKIEKMSQDQQDLHKKTCPFKPKLLNNKRSARNFEEFIKEMKKFERSKDEKLNKLRTMKGKESMIPTHAPALCKQSMKILRKKDLVQPVHQKLYNERRLVDLKKDKSKTEPLPSFSPIVNQKSHDAKRDGKANDVLYEDAVKRQKKRSISPIDIKEKFINEKSEQVLCDKFTREFINAMRKGFCEDKAWFTYSEFLFILCEMDFIKNDVDDLGYYIEKDQTVKAWKDIEGVESEEGKRVSRQRLLDFLLAIMNYEHPSYIQDIKTIHREFISFYENRHLSIFNKKNSKILKKREQTFTPSYLSSYSNCPSEILQKKSQFFFPRSPQDDDKKSLKNFDFCTFKPKIIRGLKIIMDQSFNDNDSLSSEYIKLSEDPGSKSSHRAEILYNFSKIAQERLNQRNKEIMDTEISFSDSSLTPNGKKTMKFKRLDGKIL